MTTLDVRESSRKCADTQDGVWNVQNTTQAAGVQAANSAAQGPGCDNVPPAAVTTADTAGTLPQLPAPTSTATPDVRDWSAPGSVGAMFMSLILQCALEERRSDNAMITAEGESIVTHLLNQAQDMLRGARVRAVMGFASAAVGGIVGLAGMGMGVFSTVKLFNAKKAGLAGEQMKLVMQKLHAKTAAVDGAGKIATALAGALDQTGVLREAKWQSEVKVEEAEVEKVRVLLEQIKSAEEAMRELIASCQECANAIQANTNQTLAKILG